MQLFQPYNTDPHPSTLAVALLMATRLGKQPSCPTAKERRKKTWSVHTVGLWKPPNRRKLDPQGANGCSWSGQPQEDRHCMLSRYPSCVDHRASTGAAVHVQMMWKEKEVKLTGNKQGQGGGKESSERGSHEVLWSAPSTLATPGTSCVTQIWVQSKTARPKYFFLKKILTKVQGIFAWCQGPNG